MKPNNNRYNFTGHHFNFEKVEFWKMKGNL